MKTQEISGKISFRILKAMLINQVVCSRISVQWDQGLFSTPEENAIAEWCIRYYKRYSKVPGNDIRLAVEEIARERGEKFAQVVERLVDALQREDFQCDSTDFLLDVAGKYFNAVRYRRELERCLDLVDGGEVDEVRTRLVSLRPVELGMGSTIKVGENFEMWEEAFRADEERPLIIYPGVLGRFINQEMVRDSFVAFMAAAKRGKSFWLQDAAYRAVRLRRRVAFFEAGDMSRNQVLRRLGMRALRLPLQEGVYLYPVKYESPEKQPEYEERKFPAADVVTCFRSWRKIQGGRDLFRLQCYSNSSLSVMKIASILGEWAREGWVADVVIVDYADILQPYPGVSDRRDQINENWKMLRRISQDYHCLVLTATQSDAGGYDTKLLRRSNFSEDRRKHDHVTAMLGLNSTVEEKRLGITRVNWLDRRDRDYVEDEQVYVAGCLGIGCPIILSVR